MISEKTDSEEDNVVTILKNLFNAVSSNGNCINDADLLQYQKYREMKRDGELMKEAPVFHHLFKRNLFLILSTFFCYYYYGTFSCAFFK